MFAEDGARAALTVQVYHRGEIQLALKQQGRRLPERVAIEGLWGRWYWGRVASSGLEHSADDPHAQRYRTGHEAEEKQDHGQVVLAHGLPVAVELPSEDGDLGF